MKFWFRFFFFASAIALLGSSCEPTPDNDFCVLSEPDSAWCPPGETCLRDPDPQDPNFDGYCAKLAPAIQTFDPQVDVTFFNNNAGESGPVRINSTTTKGDLRIRKVEVARMSDETIRSLIPGEVVGTCSAVAFETGTSVFGDLTADGATSAFCDLDQNGVQERMEPTVTVNPAAAPGQPFIVIDVALEYLLPFVDDFFVNSADEEVTVDVASGVITNPSTPGVSNLPVALASIDPNGNGEAGPDSVNVVQQQEVVFFDGTPNESCAINPSNYFFEAPGARSVTIENQAVGSTAGPYAINGYPNPQNLPQAINPATRDVFENGVYVGTIAAFWQNPGVCGDVHLQNGGGDDPILGPNPDPAGCGYGCLVFDNNAPNQAPEIVPNTQTVNMTDDGAGNQGIFKVSVVDEQPDFLAIDVNGPSFFSLCSEDSRASEDSLLNVFYLCQLPSGSAGTSEVWDTFASDGILSDTGTLNININPATGTIPTLDPFANPILRAEGAPFALPVIASGGDGQIELGSLGLPDFCFQTDYVNGTGAVNCNPPAGSARRGLPYIAYITATDADADQTVARLDLDIAPFNTAPVVEEVPDFNARFGTSVFFSIDVTDTDGDFVNQFPNQPDFINVQITGDAALYCSAFYNNTGQPERSISINCFFPVSSGAFDGTLIVTDTGVPPQTVQRTFTVTAVDSAFNTAPQCSDISTTVSPDADLTIPIEFFDAELDQVNYAETSGNASCSFTNNFNGTATYSCGAPLPLGELSSTFTATDSRGSSCDASVTVTVSDDPVNLPPVANDDSLGAVIAQFGDGLSAEDSPFGPILLNDNDPEGETLLMQNVSIISQPSIGELENNNPGPGFFAYTGPVSSDTFSFEYTVADSLGEISNVATATFEPSGFVSNGAFVGPNGEPRTTTTDFYYFEPATSEVGSLGSVPDWGQAVTPPLFVTDYSGTEQQEFFAQVSAEALIADGLDVADNQAWTFVAFDAPDPPVQCRIYWRGTDNLSGSCRGVAEGNAITIEARDRGTDELFWDQTVIAADTDTYLDNYWYFDVDAEEGEALAGLYADPDVHDRIYLVFRFDTGEIVVNTLGDFVNGAAAGAAAGEGGAAGGAAGAGAIGIPVGSADGGGGGGGIIITNIELENAFDFGDAPDASVDPSYLYPTLLAQDGARHGTSTSFHLGSEIDFEQNGIPSAAADGDDADNGLDFPLNDNPDDEDGISFDTSLLPGLSADISIDATIENGADSAFVSAWIDVNRDGDWLDAGEQVLNNFVVIDGINTATITLPVDGTEGTTYARFRMSAVGNVGFSGPAASGEVEDYLVNIADQDIDGDGVLAYLDNCPDTFNPGQEDILERGVGDACALPADFDGDGNVDWLDVGLYLGSEQRNRPATTPYDPFDLDGNGIINLLDARKALLLCDVQGCAIL